MADGTYAPYKQARKQDNLYAQSINHANTIYAKTKDPSKIAISLDQYIEGLSQAAKTGTPYKGSPFVRQKDGSVAFVYPDRDFSGGVYVSPDDESVDVFGGKEALEGAEQRQYDQSRLESIGVSNAEDGRRRLAENELDRKVQSEKETSDYDVFRDMTTKQQYVGYNADMAALRKKWADRDAAERRAQSMAEAPEREERKKRADERRQINR
jgi:hypothetical protein